VEDVQIGQLRLQLGQQGGLVDLGQRTIDAFVVENVHGRFRFRESPPARAAAVE